MGWFDSITDWVDGAAGTVATGVTDVANTVASGVVDAGNSFAGDVTSAWEATSDEAKVVAEEVEKAGLVIDSGFIDGANAVKDASYKVADGLVELGNYATQHACDIALGSALSAAFIALAADGAEEGAVSVVLAASLAGDFAALKVAAHGLAMIVAEPVWLIPGVSAIKLTKEQFEDVIAFIVYKACAPSPELVVGTAGQFIVGVLLYGITSLVCEGCIPGGYEVWTGVQNV